MFVVLHDELMYQVRTEALFPIFENDEEEDNDVKQVQVRYQTRSARITSVRIPQSFQSQDKTMLTDRYSLGGPSGEETETGDLLPNTKHNPEDQGSC